MFLFAFTKTETQGFKSYFYFCLLKISLQKYRHELFLPCRRLCMGHGPNSELECLHFKSVANFSVSHVDSLTAFGCSGSRLWVLYQEIFIDRNPFRAEIKASIVWMSLLSDLNKNQRTPHKQNLLGLYNSVASVGKYCYWVFEQLSLLECIFGLGVLSITSVSSLMTILPLVSQLVWGWSFQVAALAAIHLKIPRFLALVWEPTPAVWFGQQTVHGAGYWEINTIYWKFSDGPSLCASAVPGGAQSQNPQTHKQTTQPTSQLISLNSCQWSGTRGFQAPETLLRVVTAAFNGPFSIGRCGSNT